MVSKQTMNKDNKQKTIEKEISPLETLGLLQEQIKKLVQVLQQHDTILTEHQKLLDIIVKSDEKFQRLF